MKKLTYYKFYFHPSEIEMGRKDGEFNNGKLYSALSEKEDAPEYLDNILFSPPNSNGYSANMKLPKEDIVFYDFMVWDTAFQLDDFMESVEVNPIFGFFVSPKLKTILSEYNLSAHRFYPVNVHFKSNTHKYYFLLISHEENSINYPKSTFLERYNKTQKVIINSYDELTEQQTDEENGQKFWVERDIDEQIIVFDKEMDIYSVVTAADGFLYFSERLKKRLENDNVTGMKFYYEAEDPEFFLNT